MTTTELKDMMVDHEANTIKGQISWIASRIQDIQREAKAAQEHTDAGHFDNASRYFQELARTAQRLVEDAHAAALAANSAATVSGTFHHIEQLTK